MEVNGSGSVNTKDCLDFIPEGSSIGLYRGVKYQITKEVFNRGKSQKLLARQLGGNDFISLNFYSLNAGDQLRPCEMPREKVISFLQRVEILNK